jgi:hypothetical protein
LEDFSRLRLSLDEGQIRKDVNFISAWLSESGLRILSDIQKLISGLKITAYGRLSRNTGRKFRIKKYIYRSRQKTLI